MLKKIVVTEHPLSLCQQRSVVVRQKGKMKREKSCDLFGLQFLCCIISFQKKIKVKVSTFFRLLSLHKKYKRTLCLHIPMFKTYYFCLNYQISLSVSPNFCLILFLYYFMYATCSITSFNGSV